ncbi:MAG: ImpA family type VI secretion system protein [Planctomycetota bacterium]|jgi:type VI secretion system protein ImpA
MTMLDVEKLLAPINSEAPCGRPLEEDENSQAAYYEMETAYKTARLIQKSQVELEKLASKALRNGFREEKKGLPNDPAKNPDWNSVADLGCQLLYQCSKDARLLGRLFEPMTRLYGLEGFLAVARGAMRLVDTYGTDLYPRADDDPTIVWQNLAREQNSETFLDSFRWIRIESRNPVCFACKFRIETTLTLPSLTEDDIAELKSNSDFLDANEFNESLQRLDSTSIETFRSSLTDAVAAAQDLDNLLQSKAPGTEFRFNKVLDLLQEIDTWFEKTFPSPVSNEEAIANADGGAGTASGASTPKTGPVGSREEALRQLKQVAEFFRKTEPHSPLSYALEQTVRWGGMSLPDLLKEFIDSDEVLNGVYRRMGIQIKEE